MEVYEGAAIEHPPTLLVKKRHFHTNNLQAAQTISTRATKVAVAGARGCLELPHLPQVVTTREIHGRRLR